MPPWTFDHIPDQSGRVALVTGANAGLGFETARALAQKGAKVLLACRDVAKAEAAAARIASEGPTGHVEVEPLDLADLASVEALARRLAARPRLDLLIANAGVMVPPAGRTKQGFELQLGTNHLGHFALVGRLFPQVERTAGSRVVVVSSLAQRIGRIDLHDLHFERRPYRAWPAYGQSKLANMLFALELHRRAHAAGAKTRVVAAHPGWTATDLQRTHALARFFSPLLAMSAARGALTTLRAATDPHAPSGSYWGPSGLGELRGHPVPARISERALDSNVARELWEQSEALTGVSFRPAPAA